MITKVLDSFASYLKNGSGWVLKRVIELIINVSKLNPLKGSSHIPLPKLVARSKGLINMKNTDEQCFKWAVTRALNPVVKDPQKVTKILQKQSERLDWEGLEFPTPCSERMFKKFERNNDVSLLVFGHSDKNIIPLYVSTERREKVARLFFVRQGGQTHYCVINDMSALVGSQTRAKKNKKIRV